MAVSGDLTHSLSQWLSHIKADDIDGGLAADFDGSLSGLGMELGSSTYNMSEALMALPVFKNEAIEQGTFQYILGAATSPATKLYDETLTYLNQGQPYEVKLKKTIENGSVKSHIVKSVVRVVFHDRRLQYTEHEQIAAWRQNRPGERILDIDIPLSYGVSDIKVSDTDLGAIEFTWDQSLDTGVYLKVNCISTEFTAKKHGGEKGVPFRLQIETYARDDSAQQLVHAASCQIRVFKPKGADRKNKTDRGWIERRTEAEKAKYQSSYECTVLIEVGLDQVKGYLDHKKCVESKEKDESPASVEQPAVVSEEKSTTKVKRTSTESCVKCEGEETEESGEKSESPVSRADVDRRTLDSTSTAQQVTQWLHRNRFSNYARTFQNFSGGDLLRLSRDDLIQICGLADGIRLNNALQLKSVRPRLTIYVYQGYKTDWTSVSTPKPYNFALHNPPRPSQSTSEIDVSLSQFSSLVLQNTDPTPSRSPPTSHSPPTSQSPPNSSHSSSNESDNQCSTDSSQPASSRANSKPVKKSPPVPIATTQISSNERKTKRQYGDYDSSEDIWFAKKQRTRSLQLYPKSVYHAIYLDQLTLTHLKDKLAQLFSIQPRQISQVCVHGPSCIPVLVNDDVVQNFVADSRFSIEGLQEEETDELSYIIMLNTDTNTSEHTASPPTNNT